MQVMTRAQAKARGLKRYYSVPCGRGHESERYASSGKCCQCDTRAARAEYRGTRAPIVRVERPNPTMSPATTRKEARSLGLSRFFSGVACARGHLTERYTSTGACHRCVNERKTEYRTYVGEPCQSGHSGLRFTVNRTCVECERQRKKVAPRQIVCVPERKEVVKPRIMCAPELLVTREQATELGQNWFVNGLPCPRGHVGKRYVINGTCCTCASEDSRARCKRGKVASSGGYRFRPVNQRKPVPATSFPDQSEIERFIRERGVTRCPTAMAAYSTATVSEEDRAALAAHNAKQEEEFQRQWRRRTHAGRRAA